MFEIPARIYSKAIWETIRYRTKEIEPASIDESDDTRAISFGAFDLLYRITRLFMPKRVVEIGTGTGRSASAMIQGATGVVVHTCDTEPYKHGTDGYSLDFHHGTSTAMLQKLTQPVDLFFFDGRIQPEDIEHIKRLSHAGTNYLFDDFEGVEKGVANALMIQHLGGLLVLPDEGQTLGMMLRTKIGMTRQ